MKCSVGGDDGFRFVLLNGIVSSYLLSGPIEFFIIIISGVTLSQLVTAAITGLLY
jgi:hypothetical protein